MKTLHDYVETINGFYHLGDWRNVGGSVLYKREKSANLRKPVWRIRR